MQGRTISDQREPSLSKERGVWSSRQEKRERRERRGVVHLGVAGLELCFGVWTRTLR